MTHKAGHEKAVPDNDSGVLTGRPDRFFNRYVGVVTGIIGMAAALACGLQLYWLMMWGLYGEPANPLHSLAMIGTLGAFVSCVGLLCSRARGGGVVLLMATIPSWIFYGPATVISVLEIVNGRQELTEFGVIMMVPPMLLLLTTVLAVVTLRWQTELSQ